jgi:hypothetical protein
MIETDGGTPSINKIVNEVDWELVPTVAVKVADCDAVTTAADAVKLAVEVPEPTVTEAGTVSAPGLLFVNDTVVPPEGDCWLSATTQVDLPPEFSVDGEQLRLLRRSGARTESVVDDEPPFSEPVTVAVCGVFTMAVVAVKVLVDVPETTMTEVGTDTALELLLTRLTAAPPDGAF